MYGHLAHLHPQLVQAHVSKISDSIVARLKEKDATRELRETCATAFAQLVTELGADATLTAVLRPLLPLVSEPSEAYQLGCAICLTAILPAAGAQSDLPEGVAQRIATPLLRTLSHPAVGAHPALLDAAGTFLLQAGHYATRPFASPFLSSALNAASSSEWASRRAAADLMRAVAASHDEVMASFANRAHAALHLLRADKQKVVREAALTALNALRDAKIEPIATPADSSAPGQSAAPEANNKAPIRHVRQQLRLQNRPGGAAPASAGFERGGMPEPVVLAKTPRRTAHAAEGFDFSLRAPAGLRSISGAVGDAIDEGLAAPLLHDNDDSADEAGEQSEDTRTVLEMPSMEVLAPSAFPAAMPAVPALANDYEVAAALRLGRITACAGNGDDRRVGDGDDGGRFESLSLAETEPGEDGDLEECENLVESPTASGRVDAAPATAVPPSSGSTSQEAALLELAARELQRTKAAAARSRQLAEAKEAEAEAARADAAAARNELAEAKQQVENERMEAASTWQQAQGHQQGVGQIVDMRSSAGVEDAVQAAVQAALEAERLSSAQREAALRDEIQRYRDDGRTDEEAIREAVREEMQLEYEADAAAWRAERDEAQEEAAEAREREAEAAEREHDAAKAARVAQLAMEAAQAEAAAARKEAADAIAQAADAAAQASASANTEKETAVREAEELRRRLAAIEEELLLVAEREADSQSALVAAKAEADSARQQAEMAKAEVDGHRADAQAASERENAAQRTADEAAAAAAAAVEEAQATARAAEVRAAEAIAEATTARGAEAAAASALNDARVRAEAEVADKTAAIEQRLAEALARVEAAEAAADARADAAAEKEAAAAAERDSAEIAAQARIEEADARLEAAEVASAAAAEAWAARISALEAECASARQALEENQAAAVEESAAAAEQAAKELEATRDAAARELERAHEEIARANAAAARAAEEADAAAAARTASEEKACELRAMLQQSEEARQAAEATLAEAEREHAQAAAKAHAQMRNAQQMAEAATAAEQDAIRHAEELSARLKMSHDLCTVEAEKRALAEEASNLLDAELRLEASRRKEAELKLEEATAAAAENAAVSRDHSSRASAAIATTTAGAKENRNARIGTASGHVAPSLHVKGVGRVGASAGTGGRQSAATTPTSQGSTPQSVIPPVRLGRGSGALGR